MAIAIEVTCRVCGVEFAPDRRAIVTGDWHTCPRCRDGPIRTDEQPTDDTTDETKGTRSWHTRRAEKRI